MDPAPHPSLLSVFCTPSPDEKIASLLTLRPVEITFEEAKKDAATTSALAAPRKRTAPTKSKAASAVTAATKPKVGTKGKASKGKGNARAKKANKVTTVRKAFKVQARNVPQQAKDGVGGSVGCGGHAVAAVPKASSTAAAI